MNQSSKVVFINHSRILFLPVIGTLFYKIQYFLYKQGLISFLRISRKLNPERTKLLELVSKRAKYTICQSYKLRAVLKNLENEIIADFNAPKYFKKIPLEKIYDVSWTLVFSKSVTQATKRSLSDFLPVKFPETKLIVIPYHDRLDVICDFVFQTVKELARRGSIVFLIPFAGSKSIFKFFLQSQNKIKILENKFKGQDNVILYQPFSLLPLRLNKFEIIQKINQFFSFLFISLLIRKLNKPVLWCFDPRDSNLLMQNKKFCLSIYDCVDYFSTHDPKINKQIRSNEKKLIKTVDFFFVNSTSLERAKKEIRKSDMVVPQGFDVNSFASKMALTNQEKKRLKILKKLFKSIPRPRLIFVGNLTYRLDFKLLFSLVRKMPNISFVFTNAFLPMPADDRFVHTEKLLDLIRKASNVYLIPHTLSRRVVKKILEQCDIGIIPYDVSFEFNRYCYPMKLFEYFYMGKPVVSTPIEELKRFPKFVKIGKDAKEWEKHIKNLLSKSWPKEYQKQQRRLAEENSWEQKVETILQFTSR